MCVCMSALTYNRQVVLCHDTTTSQWSTSSTIRGRNTIQVHVDFALSWHCEGVGGRCIQVIRVIVAPDWNGAERRADLVVEARLGGGEWAGDEGEIEGGPVPCQ